MSIYSFICLIEKKTSPAWRRFSGLASVCIIGWIDYLLGYELSLSVFYLIPISFGTWLTGRRFGLLTSLFAACVWYTADVTTGHVYSHPLIPVWNAAIRFTFFIIVTFILSALKDAIRRERDLARFDNLTGAANSRSFYELAQQEVDRFQRHGHIFTLVYIDLDNFKAVNDRFGHPEGDRVLCTVVATMKRYMRKIDVIARLGGDEFALLLPETDEESARAVMSKIQKGLLQEMRGKWPVTFSIGVLTCRAVTPGVDGLIMLSDELMYSVKHSSKNAIQYKTCAT